MTPGIFLEELDWGSAPDPGIYRFVPIPRRDGKADLAMTKRDGWKHPASVLGPGSALGSLPSVALSSVQVRSRIAKPV
jgi:hypothetical protein